MDRSDVVAYVEERINDYKCLFGLSDWTICIQYDRLREGTPAKCETEFAYEIATITIDCDQVGDECDLDGYLKHELLHITHSPFDPIDIAVVSCSKNNALKVLYKNAMELTVKNLERMHKAHFDFFEKEKKKLDAKIKKLETQLQAQNKEVLPNEKPLKSAQPDL